MIKALRRAYLVFAVAARGIASPPPLFFDMSVVIPCIPRHIQFLDGLFSDIRTQDKPPIEVIVALSSATAEDEARVRRRFNEVFLHNDEAVPKFTLLATNLIRDAAQNRNVAVKSCTGSVIRCLFPRAECMLG